MDNIIITVEHRYEYDAAYGDEDVGEMTLVLFDYAGAGAEYDYAACVVNECCYLSA